MFFTLIASNFTAMSGTENNEGVVITEGLRVTKVSGDVVPFDEHKLVHSLERSGASESIINEVLNEVRGHLYEGIPTKQIYRIAFAILKKRTASSAARYQLKSAIAELGPTGYPFERLVGALFEHQGYRVQVGQLVQGRCVQHEVDVIAEKDGTRYMMECKFHADPDRKADVKVPLYIRSRFVDVMEAWRQTEPGLDYVGWVVTNARFTSDALDYGRCIGLQLLSWDYPHHGSLKERVDGSKLLPITCLTTLKKTEKQQLLENGVIFCRDIHADPETLNGIGLPLSRNAKVMNEVKAICNNNH
ncbi:MAG: restriction endonuclease [Flavobacteriales bacterium]|nr:restriction endonuclease [Flavobacteriales bacterium]